MAVENEVKTKYVHSVDKKRTVSDGDQGVKTNETVIMVETDYEELQKPEKEATENDEFPETQEGDGEIAEDVVDSGVTQKQANTYAAKKTVAQGMMDIALITANANQLRYIIEFNRNSSTYYLNLVLIVISLMLQIAVGVSLIFKGRMDLRGESKHAKAKRINNHVVIGIFLVTIINVFIASFTVTGSGK